MILGILSTQGKLLGSTKVTPSSGKIFKHTIRKHKLICTFGDQQPKKRIILFREAVFSFNLNFLFSRNIWFNPESNGKDLAPKSQIHNLLPLQNRTCNSIVDVETVAVEVGGITGYSWIGGNFRCHRFERERRHNKDCERWAGGGMLVGTYCCISPPLQPNSDRGGWVGGGVAQVEVMDFTCTAARVSSWPVLGVKGYKCRECSSLPLTTGAQVTRAALPESRQRSDFTRNFRMCSAIPAWTIHVLDKYAKKYAVTGDKWMRKSMKEETTSLSQNPQNVLRYSILKSMHLTNM